MNNEEEKNLQVIEINNVKVLKYCFQIPHLFCLPQTSQKVPVRYDNEKPSCGEPSGGGGSDRRAHLGCDQHQ